MHTYMVTIMEPDDNQQQQCSLKLIKMTKSQFISENSDNLRSVEEIQTSRRRRKGTMSASKASSEEHQCSSSRRNRTTFLSSWSSSSSSSSSPLVLFILASALLFFLCITPIHSLPFDGRRSLSSSGIGGGGSSSHRSHMDLLIDPIHQAEYGDDDPFENKRIVKSVFDMVLRTPPPPTTSSSRCPPGTQSPFEGGPCIKKSTDPVAFVDQSFLLDTLRGLAQEGALMRGSQKQRRPGNNRRRPSGRPGSRTTSTTTAAPSTTVSSEEDESASTTFTTGNVVADTGDNNVNVVEEVEEAVMAVTQETSPLPPSSPSLSVGETETTLPSTQEVVEEEAVKSEAGITDASASVTIIPDEGDTTTIIPIIDPVAPDDSSSSSVVVTTTTSTPPTTTTTTTEESVKNEADLRRTAEPEMTVPSSSSSITGNDELIAGTATTTQTTLKTVQPSEAPITTTPTIASVGTADLQQVKSDQVHKVEQSDEQVPTVMMSQTTQSKQESGANINTHLDNIMGNSQISLESQPAAEIQQDDHQHHTQSISLTTPSTLPTFPKGEFLTVDVTPQAHHQEKDIFVSSTISPVTVPITASSQPMRMMTTTMNPPPIPTGAVTGAENQVVTGVINPSDQPLHKTEQEIETNVQSPSFDDDQGVKIKDISAELHMPEEQAQISQGAHNSEGNGKEGVIGKMVMRMIQAGETPQQVIEHLDKVQTDKDGEMELQLSQNSESRLSALSSKLSQRPISETWSPLLILFESKEESLKDRPAPSAATSQDESKVTDAITEKTNATIGNDNEKVPRPLGPLDPSAAEIKTIVEPAQVEQQVQDGNNDSDEKAEAGDINDVAATTKRFEDEQGDNLPSPFSAVVNHLKEGDKQEENDKGRETVTLQVDNTDLPIINVNLPSPSSFSPVQQIHHHHQNEIKIVQDPVNNNDPSGNGEISSSEESGSGSRELEQSSDFSQNPNPISDQYQPVIKVSVPDTTMTPPTSTTSGPPPGSPFAHHFHPTDTLLQFQLPIVTSLPSSPSSHKNYPENGVGGENFNSFQKFQEFPSFSNSGKVRFPNSAEADHDLPAEGGQSSGKDTFKPVFVQDFNLDYPPRRHAEPPPQEWQAPQPFQLPQSEIAPEEEQKQPEIELPLAPEYYDSGSTEYLESELDRRHQKSRSRNRIRNSPEAASTPAATTNTPPVYSPELSFYSPAPASVQVQPQTQQAPPPVPMQTQQNHHNHQPSIYFARRNPSSDLIPFGYLNFRTGHDRFHHNNRRLVW